MLLLMNRLMTQQPGLSSFSDQSGAGQLAGWLAPRVPLYKNGKLARFKKNRQPLRLFEIARMRVRHDHINRTAMIAHACVC
jgi:hypothetical protein